LYNLYPAAGKTAAGYNKNISAKCLCRLFFDNIEFSFRLYNTLKMLVEDFDATAFL